MIDVFYVYGICFLDIFVRLLWDMLKGAYNYSPNRQEIQARTNKTFLLSYIRHFYNFTMLFSKRDFTNTFPELVFLQY